MIKINKYVANFGRKTIKISLKLAITNKNMCTYLTLCECV